ncbi:MAG TPA: homocysteine S-methyltransferase family protein [Aggregatilineales bacterium]|nr:homocysteine S-methyltransferase family protein [Aggregatilineales bacterium]
MRFDELLSTHPTIIADGGMGTMLIGMGLPLGSATELWNVEQPDKVRSVHRAYIQSGAQIILTNSFGGSLHRLEANGIADRCAELNENAARLARLEADSADHAVVVGGSLGPLGAFFEPIGTLTADMAIEMFAPQISALVAGGVDVLWIETMSDLQEVRAAAAACQRVAPQIPLVATMTFDKNGRTMFGVTPEQAGREITEMGAAAFGANCGNGTAEVEAVISKMHAAQPDSVLIAKANVGLPRMVEGRTVYDSPPEMMGSYARSVREKGARIIGLCCGSTPAHIAAVRAALAPAGESR